MQSFINYPFFRDKLFAYAKEVGKAAARPVLLLYFVLKSPGTPKSEKWLIVSALSYLVLPIDLISARRLPIVGWIDEVASMTYVYNKVCKRIMPEIKWKVESLLMDWFPEVEYEVIS